MAIPPAQPEDAFLREVDEEVRRARLVALWKRWGTLAVSVLLLGLGSLAGWLWWQDQKVRQAGVAGEQLTQAMTQLDVGEGARARPVLDTLAKEGPGAYPGLARLVLANDALAGGNAKRAAALYDQIAADEKLPDPIRDAARVKSVRVQFDTLPPEQVVARLKALAVPGNPWYGVAGELVALARIKAGQGDQARPLLVAIVKDETMPPSLRSRAAQLAISLGADAEALGLGGAPAGAAASPAEGAQ